MQVTINLKWLYPVSLVGMAAYIYPTDSMDGAAVFLTSIVVAWLMA